MKKMIVRPLAVLLAAILLTMTFAGCGRNGDDPNNPTETPEFIFVPEFITLPEGITDMSNLVVSGDRMFFTSWYHSEEEPFSYGHKLFSMNLDGTGLQELVNYDPGEPPEEDAQGNIQIQALRADLDGNLWVIENGNFFTFDLPDDFYDDFFFDAEFEDDAEEPLGDGEDEDEDSESESGSGGGGGFGFSGGAIARPMPGIARGGGAIYSTRAIDGGAMPLPGRDMYDYYRELESIMALRKLDETGAELLSIDISSLANNVEWFWVRTFAIDGDGNIYVATDQTIFALDKDGRLVFQLDLDNWIDQLITLADGSVAFFGWMETGRALRKINFQTRTWGDEISIPQNMHSIFPGGGDYDLIFTDSANLFGLDRETDETVKLLNWIDSDVSIDGLSNITILPDGRILCTNSRWNRGSGESAFELIILTKMPYESVPHRTIITLATIWLDWSLRSSIVDFNRSNSTYRIQVRDYSEFNSEDDWNAGLTRLTTEIITGRVPDILDVSNLPFKQYVARGLLADLYPFIDSDRSMNRSDFVESVFRATETNGGLYQIFPTFNVATLIGHPSILGETPGWNMDEFRNVLRANPQADLPFGQGMTKDAFLQQMLSVSMDEYVDWAAGACYFDSDGFIQLLEFSNTFPAEIDWERQEWLDWDELILSGRQIMMQQWVHGFDSTRWITGLFGGDVVYKGFPTESRRGNSLSIGAGLAMSSTSSNKDGAWEFMRTILTEDWQRNNSWGFTTNKTVFDERLDEIMTPYTYIDEDGNEVEYSRSSMYMGGVMIEMFAMTQEEADKIIELIDSVSGIVAYDERLMTIVNEGAADFFSGMRSAQDAARIIQSRASIFISEQS